MTFVEGVDYELDAHLCIPWNMDNELELGSGVGAVNTIPANHDSTHTSTTPSSSSLQSSQTSQPSIATSTSTTIHTQQSTFRPEMNRHGIIHVRLIRAQHLRCTDGSLLQANISLPPWKGRIRSEKVTVYHGPSSAGICARWDEKDHCNRPLQNEGDDNNVGDGVHLSIFCRRWCPHRTLTCTKLMFSTCSHSLMILFGRFLFHLVDSQAQTKYIVLLSLKRQGA